MSVKALYKIVEEIKKIDIRYGNANVENGSVDGQISYWDHSVGLWKHTETSELNWNDTSKVLTFGNFPITPSSAPTTDYQVANKKYVDDNIGGMGNLDDGNNTGELNYWDGSQWKPIDIGVLSWNNTTTVLTFGNFPITPSSAPTTDYQVANKKYVDDFTETDPVFLASPANGIEAGDITNWDNAFGWGDHASAGYLTSYTETDPVFLASPSGGIEAGDITNWDNAFGWGDHASAGYLTSYTETDPIFCSSSAYGIEAIDITNWNEAHGWGDHDLVGYLTVESDPYFTSSPAHGIEAGDITNWDNAFGWGDHASAGYLTSYTETDPVFTAWDKDYDDLSNTPTIPVLDDGTATGQMAYWNGSKWTYTETSELFWDDTNKRMGIGTTSPASTLDIRGPVGELSIDDTTTQNAKIRFRDSGVTKGSIQSDNSANMRFKVNGGDEAVRILANGNVGIGTASPSQPFHLKSTDLITSMRFEGSSGNSDIDYESGTDTFTFKSNIKMIKSSAFFQGWYDNTPSSAWEIVSVSNGVRFDGFNGTAWTYGIIRYTDDAPANSLKISSTGVGIGTASPTARLHLPACTASANTASAKIDVGVLATTPVSGNIESDGDHLYWTDSGGTRRQLDN